MGSPTSGNQRDDGKFFEDVFERMARYCGLLPIRNPLSCRQIGGGKIIPIKSNLDYALHTRTGQTGYFDCKSYQDDVIRFSQLDPKQVERAVVYNEWSVPAGFVVWFRAVNRVAFFSGRQIQQKGPGTSFRPLEGVSLGSLETMDLRPLFA